VTHAVAAAPVSMSETPAPAPVAVAPASAPAATAPAGEPVKSPMVGTVYLQPSPESPPFAKVGDAVEAGQTLFIIEAMKTMNPVPAPRGGKVVSIVVGDGQPVEFGEPLAFIE
jgi:acetyl-CoA carboxylase biotin carboxyl carrier protein